MALSLKREKSYTVDEYLALEEAAHFLPADATKKVGSALGP